MSIQQENNELQPDGRFREVVSRRFWTGRITVPNQYEAELKAAVVDTYQAMNDFGIDFRFSGFITPARDGSPNLQFNSSTYPRKRLPIITTHQSETAFSILKYILDTKLERDCPISFISGAFSGMTEDKFVTDKHCRTIMGVNPGYQDENLTYSANIITPDHRLKMRLIKHALGRETEVLPAWIYSVSKNGVYEEPAAMIYAKKNKIPEIMEVSLDLEQERFTLEKFYINESTTYETYFCKGENRDQDTIVGISKEELYVM